MPVIDTDAGAELDPKTDGTVEYIPVEYEDIRQVLSVGTTLNFEEVPADDAPHLENYTREKILRAPLDDAGFAHLYVLSSAVGDKARGKGKDAIRVHVVNRHGDYLSAATHTKRQGVWRDGELVPTWQDNLVEKVTDQADLQANMKECPRCGAYLRLIGKNTTRFETFYGCVNYSEEPGEGCGYTEDC